MIRWLRERLWPSPEVGAPEPWQEYPKESTTTDPDPAYTDPHWWDRIEQSQGRARAIAIDARHQIDEGKVRDLAEFAAKHGFDPKEIIEGVREDIPQRAYERAYNDGLDEGRRQGKEEIALLLEKAIRGTH